MRSTIVFTILKFIIIKTVFLYILLRGFDEFTKLYNIIEDHTITNYNKMNIILISKILFSEF